MKIENKIVLFFFLGAVFYIWTVSSMLIGVAKERESAICVTPYEIDRMNSLIKLAEGVYLNPKNELKEILDAALEEKELWRDKYYSLKRQSERAAEEKKNEL